ncbi:unnamed protein product, partial [Discosporangium mesarthrocarpum]
DEDECGGGGRFKDDSFAEVVRVLVDRMGSAESRKSFARGVLLTRHWLLLDDRYRRCFFSGGGNGDGGVGGGGGKRGDPWVQPLGRFLHTPPNTLKDRAVLLTVCRLVLRGVGFMSPEGLNYICSAGQDCLVAVLSDAGVPMSLQGFLGAWDANGRQSHFDPAEKKGRVEEAQVKLALREAVLGLLSAVVVSRALPRSSAIRLATSPLPKALVSEYITGAGERAGERAGAGGWVNTIANTLCFGTTGKKGKIA